jgi:hypothetical protein
MNMNKVVVVTFPLLLLVLAALILKPSLRDSGASLPRTRVDPGLHAIVEKYPELKQAFNSLQEEQVLLKKELKLLQTTNAESLSKLMQQITALQQRNSISEAGLMGQYSENTGERDAGNQSDVLHITQSGISDERRIENMENKVFQQDIDPGWSDSARNQIDIMVNAENFQDSTLVNSDCRTSLCLLDIEHDSDESRRKFIFEFPNKLGWNNSSAEIVTLNENGRISTRIVITRPGFDGRI